MNLGISSTMPSRRFSSLWKSVAGVLASFASILALGALSHGACTAYASTSRVLVLEQRVTTVEATQAQIAERLKSVDGKLDLAIELLKK
jgi:hypothetical protein